MQECKNSSTSRTPKVRPNRSVIKEMTLAAAQQNIKVMKCGIKREYAHNTMTHGEGGARTLVPH